MNPYIVPVKCDICGGEGVATMRAAAELWHGGQIVHKDPSICAANLKDKMKRLEELEKKEAANNNSNL